MKTINLLSSPRNISTALMYSFAQRTDMQVFDEPYYAYYLSRFYKLHPGRDVILATLPHSFQDVAEMVKATDEKHSFVKNMAHHMRDTDWNLLTGFFNVLLIRNPYQLIASFAQVYDNPKMEDVGVKLLYDLFHFFLERGVKIPVLDSGELLKNPRSVLIQLCDKIGIPFDEHMLSWKAGPRPEDGTWARYWYTNVHKSTGFSLQKTSGRSLPVRLIPLFEESQPMYKFLSEYSIKA